MKGWVARPLVGGSGLGGNGMHAFCSTSDTHDSRELGRVLATPMGLF